MTTDDIKAHWGTILIASPESRIIKTDKGIINPDKADVIEFIRSTIKEPQPRKTDEDIKKEEEDWLKIFIELGKNLSPPRTIKYYPPLVDKEIIERYRSQKRIERGRLWVQLKYYSSYDADAQIISKDKWLEDKYNYYKRWIIKNSKISKDKMFYIGKETYVLYKEAGYKMMGGPIVEIEFE